MKKAISILAFSFFIFVACNKNKKMVNNKEISVSPTVKADSVQSHTLTHQEFSKTRKQPSDFVSNTYEIQYEAKGDLNLDGLADIALVLRNKVDTLDRRKILILLKNPDKSYRLDKTSDTVFPEEYNEVGYRMHDTEDISIDKGTLHINLYDIGPNGNLFSQFKYFNGDLVLTYIETYNMGAGSHSGLYYEPIKGKVIEETVNTMEEDMPSESKTFQVSKKRFLFENISPKDIIVKTYNSMKE
ncbi:hypothetical protein [Chryseobacterium rhizosphaerae]|uniref:hypothetical protein n=1 Tax=Chryseobacterium rhizosphaerae TaxID=395937 RepID=UPI002359BB9D|nr:hypothetical protein [Chryseobacterium rhizosphaerae]MDC8101352.1 hypothetical protein [Chryseobacterium rhizosphaerae]